MLNACSCLLQFRLRLAQALGRSLLGCVVIFCGWIWATLVPTDSHAQDQITELRAIDVSVSRYARGFDIDFRTQEPITFRWKQEDRNVTIAFGSAGRFFLNELESLLHSELLSVEVREQPRAGITLTLRRQLPVSLSQAGNLIRMTLGETDSPSYADSLVQRRLNLPQLAPDAPAPQRASASMAFRTGRHPRFQRLVLLTDEPFSAVYENGAVVITHRSAFTLDLDKLGRDLKPQVLTPRLEANRLTLPLAPAFQGRSTVRTLALEGRAVIDIVFAEPPELASTQTFPAIDVLQQEALAPEPVPQNADLPVVPVRIGLSPNMLRLIFDWPSATNYAFSHAQDLLTLTFARDARLNLNDVTLPRQGYTIANPQQTRVRGSVQFSLTVPDTLQTQHYRSDNRIIVDIMHSADLVEIVRSLQDLITPVPRASQLPVTPIADVALDLPEGVATATFKRGEWYFFISNIRQEINVASIRDQLGAALSEITQDPHLDATVIRMKLQDGLHLRIRRRGFDWGFEVLPEATPPQEHPVYVEIANTTPTSGALRIRNLVPGPSLAVTDYAVGDRILVGLTPTDYARIPAEQAFPELQLLETLQGVAVLPFADSMTLVPTSRGFSITKPMGLHLSPVSYENYLPLGETTEAPLLAFYAWPETRALREVRNDYNRRLDLMQKATDVVSSVELKLAYATYLLGQNLVAEALGILGSVETLDPDFRSAIFSEVQTAVHDLLSAAGHILLGREQQALSAVQQPQLSRYSESQLWYAVALAQQEQWQLADRVFNRIEPILLGYPAPLRTRLGWFRLESALQAGDLANAREWLTLLSQGLATEPEESFNRKAALFYRTWLEGLEGADVSANLNQLEASNDLYWETRAAWFGISNPIDPRYDDRDEAVARLERLYQSWRGDNFALRIVNRLAQFYIEDGSYKRGLSLLREALARYPKSLLAKSLAQDMVTTFRNAFLTTDPARELNPIDAYQLFLEFRELTTNDADGNLLLWSLGDRLAASGAFDLALRFYREQLLERLEGADKLKLLLTMSALELLQEQPEQALERLSENQTRRLLVQSQNPTLSADHKLLLIKAMLDSGDLSQAERMLSVDNSLAAELLRRELYTQSQNWDRLARVLERLTPDPPTDPDRRFSPQEATNLIDWALALYQSGNTPQLRALEQRYTQALEGTAFARVFEFIHSPLADTSPVEIIAQFENVAQRQSALEIIADGYVPAGALVPTNPSTNTGV